MPLQISSTCSGGFYGVNQLPHELSLPSVRSNDEFEQLRALTAPQEHRQKRCCEAKHAKIWSEVGLMLKGRVRLLQRRLSHLFGRTSYRVHNCSQMIFILPPPVRHLTTHNGSKRARSIRRQSVSLAKVRTQR